MKRSVYIDTTIPSFYAEQREEPEMVAMRIWTRRWWDQWRDQFDVYASDVVEEELRRGEFPGKAEGLALLEYARFLALTDEVIELAEYLAMHTAVPRGADSFHLALASFYKMDFLLSWNLRHMVNPRKSQHIREVLSRCGEHVPHIYSPQLLLEELEGA